MITENLFALDTTHCIMDMLLIFGTAKYDFDASSVKFQPNVYNMMTL